MDKYEDLFNPSFLKPKSNIPSPLPKEVALAMAYIPFQQQAVVYSEEARALEAGTLFPELDKPFKGKGVLR